MAMKHLALLLSLFLFSLAPAIAQEMRTTRQVTVIDDDKPSLNSDRKEKLSMSVAGRAFTGAFFVPAGTKVRVVSSQTYVKQETVGPTSKLLKRNFTAGVIEVLEGQHQGKKGWAVIDVQDEGRHKDVYISAESSGRQRTGTPTAAAPVDPNAPDLVPGTYGNTHANVAGKQIYGVSVVNQGGGEAKGAFDVTVTVGGRVVKTEKVRNLRPGGAHSFTFEVSDAHVRNRAAVEITVDPGNSIKEGDESNNVRKANL